ncbi:hypothetical protein A374_06981 [Fictibacillus macauensis ZFHKF-1]|uniref:Uncharacterized protein n=1 Tax=Fictibacillus macauensis ZFHKF-1 TaxID=1196324 RepID=I8AKG1_9BACL|nr:hypothetical protein [Fictibacillus macauensis]EIT86044.1 hypothetical protein A374_06981 [Fictibacillus macauensis ZFHKF-1]
MIKNTFLLAVLALQIIFLVVWISDLNEYFTFYSFIAFLLVVVAGGYLAGFLRFNKSSKILTIPVLFISIMLSPVLVFVGTCGP